MSNRFSKTMELPPMPDEAEQRTCHPPERPSKPRPKKSKKAKPSVLGRTIAVLLTVVLVVFVGYSAFALYAIGRRQYDNSAVSTASIARYAPEDVRTYLLVGTDERGTETGRADTIMLLSISKQNKTITLTSIMRDTYVGEVNPQLVRINEAYLRTQTANFHGSVSTDCPHRERLAYTGDGQVVVESSLYSFDMTQFYRKWFDDINDARNKKSGYVPHTAPFGGGGGGPAWGSAYLIMPWAYYCFYGDTTILSQHYEGMKQWVHYLSTRTDERGIVVREEPDGWCLGDWCTPGNRKIELPESLVNTAYYYHCASLLSKIETVLGKTKERQETERLCEEIRHNFNTVFFNPATHHYWEGRQGADIFPLAFGIVPESEKEAVLQALLSSLKKTNYHFDTGILATPLLLKVLSENGYTDIAFRLMNQRDVPGFGGGRQQVAAGCGSRVGELLQFDGVELDFAARNDRPQWLQHAWQRQLRLDGLRFGGRDRRFLPERIQLELQLAGAAAR